MYKMHVVKTEQRHFHKKSANFQSHMKENCEEIDKITKEMQ